MNIVLDTIALFLQFQGKANTIKYGKIFLLVN